MSVNCQCIKGNFNFFAHAIDLNNILYKDFSDWMSEDGYSEPTSMIINVIPPGTSKSTDFTIIVNSNNKLKWEGQKLKSGVYCFSTESCGKHYTKSVALFPNLRCCIKQAWATLDIDKQDKIREVESYLDRAATNAEFNNVKAAAQNLDIAEKLLKNLKCDCSC
jgi:hypothetical protein